MNQNPMRLLTLFNRGRAYLQKASSEDLAALISRIGGSRCRRERLPTEDDPRVLSGIGQGGQSMPDGRR
jgi:hypothetical protein